MRKLYLLVAAAGRAKLFRAELPLSPTTPPVLIYDQVHYLGKRPGGSDGEGAVADGREAGGASEAEFARELCRHLDKACRGEQGAGLVLIAPAPFLDTLHQQLSMACREALLDSLDTDLVQAPPEQLAALLASVQTKSRGITLSQLSE